MNHSEDSLGASNARTGLARVGDAWRRATQDPDAFVGRAAAVGAVLLAIVLTALVLLGQGDPSGYHVKIRFHNAGQLVEGSPVKVAGTSVGSVARMEVAPDGVAEIEITLDDSHAPLRAGTRALVRAPSLSGIANRFVELQLAPQTAPALPSGSEITLDHTASAVDIDKAFGTFDRRTQTALSNLIRGFARADAGRGDEINAGLLYLNPALVASTRLFDELTRDRRELARFLVASARFTGDVDQRGDELASLVDHLATTMEALSSRRTQLAASLKRLPPFMRQANTTFVDARATLDDLDPLVTAARPVTPKLRPLFAELRGLAAGSRPTLRDLSAAIRTPGRDNDSIDLLRGMPALRAAALEPVEAGGRAREPAFKAAAEALEGSTPLLAFARPYSVDLIGWFDDFSHTGTYDANGAAARLISNVNAFSIANDVAIPIPPELRAPAFRELSAPAQTDRCPGSVERDPGDGSTPYLDTPGFACDPTEVPLGP